MDKFKSDEPKKQSRRRDDARAQGFDERAEDGATLWEMAVEDVAPLKGRARRKPAAPEAKPSKNMGTSLPKALNAGDKRKGQGQAVMAPPVLEGSAPPPRRVDARLFEKIRRGKIPIEARLDLHGMNRDEAYAALVRFVVRVRSQGVRMVLVITGKGGDSSNPLKRGGGVLQSLTPEWLAAPPLDQDVLAVSPAKPKDGGAGALYVYLRKSL